VSLEIKNLRVVYRDGDHGILALDDLCLAVEPGRCLALVGESGSGKTTCGKACLGLLPGNAEVRGGILLNGTPLDLGNEAAMNLVRWSEISMVFQHGEETLNPVHRVLDQVAEPLLAHGSAGGEEALQRASLALEGVGIGRELHARYPHQMSGGQLQRVLCAMAGIMDPRVLILDEPTSALDALSKGVVARMIQDAKKSRKCVLLITHDLDFAVNQSDDMAVLYLGQILETLPARELLTRPLHPYTLALGRSYPALDRARDLSGMRGDAFYRFVHRHGLEDEAHAPHSHIRIPESAHRDGHAPPTGCLFQNRCTQALPECGEGAVPLETVGSHGVRCLRKGIVNLLELRGVSKTYGKVEALRGMDLEVKAGEVLALVGETGSGKTTLAMCAAGAVRPEEGRRTFDGRDMEGWIREDYRSLARRIGVIYQNPAESISHRFSVFEAVAEPLRIHGGRHGEADLAARVRRALDDVHLSSDRSFLDRYTHELNMGAIQRICLARALVLGPDLLVADEPTSSLDPSVQAKVMKLLLDLQVERGLTLLFVTHDIGLARKISDRIGVMLSGRMVELGPAALVLQSPLHPYTRLLLESAAGRAPQFNDSEAGDSRNGCDFAARCPLREDRCLRERPILRNIGSRAAACHLASQPHIR